MLGLGAYLQACPDNPKVRRLLGYHAIALADHYHATKQPSWHWFEDVATYANAKLPEAMLVAAYLLDENAIALSAWIR